MTRTVQEVVTHTESPSAVRIYTVVLTVGICSALAIVTVYETTRPIIQRNRLAARQRAILEVLPDATRTEALLWNESNEKLYPAPQNSDSDESIFAGFDQSGELVGLAIETQGMGYQDRIRVIYGYSFAQQAIIGLRVLESRETPGLGDRIETDTDFARNFHHLDVRLNALHTALENEIEFVKPGQKSEAWQIDGITGATISSRAVTEMLHWSTLKWIPRLHDRQSEIASIVREGG